MPIPPPVLTPPPPAGADRRLSLPPLSTVAFLAALAVLLAMGLASLVAKPRHPGGLPDDADALAAAAEVTGRVSVATNELRWSAAVLGGEPSRHAADADMLRRAANARTRLELSARRHAADPRPLAALAALDMAAHDYVRAARRYRRACELAPRYGEGRLGAGVALALEADRTPDPWQSRALRLQAIAQFAMVDPSEREHALALYDRVRLLREVGRTPEADHYAGRYRALDDTSHWARSLATP